jgi:phospholipid/cholesterol/gamma-HCH transport system substrate-binding protein
MKSNRVNYIIVGSFVIAVLAGLVVAVAMLTGRTGATDIYYATYKNVTGIAFGTRVLYQGYPVGQVERIEPVRQGNALSFRVEMSIIQGWRIPEDSVAEVLSSGLLAAVTIGLKAGKSSTALAPGGRIPSRDPANILTAMSDLAGDISRLAESDIKPLLASIGRTVGGLGDILDSKGGAVAADIQTLTHELAEKAPAIIARLDSLSGKLNASADMVAGLITPGNVKRAEEILANLQGASREMAGLSKDLGESRKSVERILQTIATMLVDNRLDLDRSVVDMRHAVESVARHIDAINQNLEGAARNMYEFSRQIRQNPGLLMGGTPPKDEAAQ